MAAINTRFLTIQLDIDSENVGSAAGTAKTVFITANSGVQDNGQSYLSCEAIIQRSVGFLADNATIIIKGMSQANINTFTRTNLAGPLSIFQGNRVTVYAGYNLGSGGLPPIVFQGYTLKSAPDYNIDRDRPFIMNAYVQYNVQQTIAPTVNIQGTVTIDSLFRTIVENAGFTYQSTGVKGNTTNPIYYGDFATQLTEATRHFGYYFKPTGGDNTIIAVAPIGQPLINQSFDLNVETGMIGYPWVEDYGFGARCYFNPSLRIGQQMTVTSQSLSYINNTPLYINGMVHKLQNKGTDWFTELQLNTFPFSSANT